MFQVVEAEDLRLEDFQVLEISSRRALRQPGLPGSLRLEPSFLEQGSFGRYRCAEEARLLACRERIQVLAELGLHPARPLLISGVGAWGPVNAGRVAWALLEVGFSVTWLNGGTRAWVGPLQFPDRPRPGPTWETPGRCLSVDRKDLQHSVLLDVRSRREFNGQWPDRYRFFRCHGHIPGARCFGNWTQFVKADRRLRKAEDLRPLWSGLAREHPLVFYCGTGWRSSLACCLSLWLGYRNVRNFDGGMYCWTEGALDGRVCGV